MKRHQPGREELDRRPTVAAGDHLGRRAHPAVREPDRVDERTLDDVAARVGHAEAADERLPRRQPARDELHPGDDQVVRQRDLGDRDRDAGRARGLDDTRRDRRRPRRAVLV